jgi:hypothetical protein
LGTKWFDTEFIASFTQLLAHDAHIDKPQFAHESNRVKVITCPFPQAQVKASNVVMLDRMTSHLLLVAFKNDHFAVLEFNVSMREVLVFDGLCRKINQWKEHVIHTIRTYGLVDVSAGAKSTFSEQRKQSSTAQRVEITFGDQAGAPWILRNSVYLQQKDSHNCGPIACAKVMEVLGYVEKGTINGLGSLPGGYCRAVMNKFSELLSK